MQTIPGSLSSGDLHSGGGFDVCTQEGLRDDSLIGEWWQGMSLEPAFRKQSSRHKDMLCICRGVSGLRARFSGS